MKAIALQQKNSFVLDGSVRVDNVKKAALLGRLSHACLFERTKKNWKADDMYFIFSSSIF